ncbi:PREDICTED: uncharacterized protein LOC104821171 [Tarenaya hassleriana]|uniref:uncharacterized protein LOC104821171 n=1 Tax=Tarenaya hassleriana TaxID=28532 RepID=UPI00053C61D4|nr:PREDICTED: uncharacterized protein LOC104821171 [Tarenaya hassleriana]
MASSISLPYQRLTHEGSLDEIHLLQPSFRRQYPYRFNRLRRRRRRIRVRVHKLRRFLRKKAKGVRTGISKVLKRLKESQAHFGDLFAGNYLFMQVNPTCLKYAFDPSLQSSNAFSLPPAYM